MEGIWFWPTIENPLKLILRVVKGQILEGVHHVQHVELLLWSICALWVYKCSWVRLPWSTMIKQTKEHCRAIHSYTLSNRQHEGRVLERLAINRDLWTIGDIRISICMYAYVLTTIKMSQTRTLMWQLTFEDTSTFNILHDYPFVWFSLACHYYS